MFGFKKKTKTVELVSPINGKMILLKDVPDKVFASEMMGPGVAFITNDGKVYSPCDGELATVFPTKHALGLKANNGAEILLHFGLDTVELEGEGFTLLKEAGEKIQKGDLLLEVDIDEVQNKGYKIDMPMIITNSSEYSINISELSDVTANQEIVMSLEKK
jgi:sugar PTS system EIIA component